MSEILNKLKSRKFWLALAGTATGIALAFGVEASDIQTVTGAVTTIISVVAYVIMEGKVDAVAMRGAALTGIDVTDLLDGESGE